MSIIGMHAILYTTDVDADRAFLRDVLGFPSVDAGHGWLIFAAPPTEVAVHPTDGHEHQELYLMCDDLEATAADLRDKGVETGAIQDQRWGRLTQIRLPSGASLGLYQPRHPMAIGKSR